MKKVTIILALFALVLFLSSCVQNTNYYTGSIYLPQWGHLYCGQRPEQVIETFTLNNNDRQEYFCSAPTIRAYMPNGCNVDYKRPFALFFLPDIPAHIVQRGHSRAPVLFEDQDYRAYLN